MLLDVGMTGTVAEKLDHCRVSHLLMDLGWVDFELGVPPPLPAAQPILPKPHQPKPTRADNGTRKVQANPT